MLRYLCKIKYCIFFTKRKDICLRKISQFVEISMSNKKIKSELSIYDLDSLSIYFIGCFFFFKIYFQFILFILFSFQINTLHTFSFSLSLEQDGLFFMLSNPQPFSLYLARCDYQSEKQRQFLNSSSPELSIESNEIVIWGISS